MPRWASPARRARATRRWRWRTTTPPWPCSRRRRCRGRRRTPPSRWSATGWGRPGCRCSRSATTPRCAAGRTDGLVAELDALTAQHPFHERFLAQFMLALAAAGQQSRALEVYRSARVRLDEELGVQPSEQLRRAQQLVLAGEGLGDDDGAAGAGGRPHGIRPAGAAHAAPATDPAGRPRRRAGRGGGGGRGVGPPGRRGGRDRADRGGQVGAGAGGRALAAGEVPRRCALPRRRERPVRRRGGHGAGDVPAAARHHPGIRSGRTGVAGRAVPLAARRAAGARGGRQPRDGRLGRPGATT